MEADVIIRELKNNAVVFKGLLGNTLRHQQYWRSEPNKWNLLEIICHLLDEEQEDWRARVELLLLRPEQDFAPIDPEGWVKTRDYAEQDFQSKLDTFLLEREKNIVWLSNLGTVNWENFKTHHHFGDMSAQLYLENWLAHDLLHIRQIIRLKNEYLRSHSEVNFEYAGNW